MTLGETVDVGAEIAEHGGYVMACDIVLEGSDADVVRNVHAFFERREDFFMSVDEGVVEVDDVVGCGEESWAALTRSLSTSKKSQNASMNASAAAATSLRRRPGARHDVMKWVPGRVIH